MADDPGLFVFGGGEVDFYPSVELAAGAIERVDVDAGEYEGFFTVEGERFVPRAMDEWNVELRATGKFRAVRPSPLASRRTPQGHRPVLQ